MRELSLGLVLLLLLGFVPSPVDAAEEGIDLVGKADAVRVPGEEQLIYRKVRKGRALGVRVQGPGEMTLRLRKQLPRRGGAQITVKVPLLRDGEAVGGALALRGPGVVRTKGRRGLRLGSAVIQTVPIPEGEHVVTVGPIEGGEVVVSFAFAATVATSDALALAPLAPLVVPEPQTAERTITAVPRAEAERREPPVRIETPAPVRRGTELSVTPRVGAVFHPGLGAGGPAAGLSATAGIALDGRFAVGVAVDYHAFELEALGLRLSPRTLGDARISFWSLPILAVAQLRFPMRGIEPYVGAGAGAVIESGSTGVSGSASVPERTQQAVGLGGMGLLGLALPTGHGRVVVEGRYNIASDEVDGASKVFSTGSIAGQTGYQLVF